MLNKNICKKCKMFSTYPFFVGNSFFSIHKDDNKTLELLKNAGIISEEADYKNPSYPDINIRKITISACLASKFIDICNHFKLREFMLLAISEHSPCPEWCPYTLEHTLSTQENLI